MRSTRRTLAVIAVLLCLTPLCLLTTPAEAQNVVATYYNVQASAATDSQAQPHVLWGNQDYFIYDQGFHKESCVRYFFPYGALSNGNIEFPGDLSDSASLAYKCVNTIAEGQCYKMTVQVLDGPTVFGATRRATTLTTCW